MTDQWTLPGGAVLEELSVAPEPSRISIPKAGEAPRSCEYHRLHLPFLPCHEAATFLLTKAHGETVLLCAHHAHGLRQRYDSSSASAEAHDDGLDLAWSGIAAASMMPDTMATPAAIPVFEGADFAGGRSGGAGAGADFGDTGQQTAQQDSTPILDAAPSIPDAPVMDSTSFDAGSSGTTVDV